MSYVPPNSDAEGYDRARDELAVPCPYAEDWLPPYRHGPVTDTTLGLTEPERPGVSSTRVAPAEPPLGSAGASTACTRPRDGLTCRERWQTTHQAAWCDACLQASDREWDTYVPPRPDVAACPLRAAA